MTVNVSNEQIVIPAGSQEVRQLPGAQVICYQSDGEAFISMDQRGWLPFSRGIELNSANDPFETLYFKNPTGASITLEVAVVSDPRVFVDRRELAAQVAIDGGVQVNNSPYYNEGGIVTKVGDSLFEIQVDNTAGGATQETQVFSGAENVGGAFILRREINITSAPAETSANTCYLRTTGPWSYNFRRKGVGLFDTETPLFIGAGDALYVATGVGFKAWFMVHYTLI